MKHWTIELEREQDGRWIAEISDLWIMVYGASETEARAKAMALAEQVIADRLDEAGQ
jgi:hypothetical protein